MTEAVIMEIRAGTGGDEAALFVGDLFRMYTNFAVKKGWKSILLSASLTSLGGYRTIEFEVEGAGTAALLAYEGGVHRIQRIPKTEKSGRVHTSTATIAVLKKVTEKEFHINPAELLIEFTKSSGPGGQNVNKRETAVRVTHQPTGVVVEAQSERGQAANREAALSILRSKLAEHARTSVQKEEQVLRRQQIGTGERAEKIRTYNVPQDRVTDHRIKKKWHGIESIMAGKIEPILKALTAVQR
jgi:peptide chain release factor 1